MSFNIHTFVVSKGEAENQRVGKIKITGNYERKHNHKIRKRN